MTENLKATRNKLNTYTYACSVCIEKHGKKYTKLFILILFYECMLHLSF